MYIDSHAHLCSDELFPNFPQLWERASLAGVEKVVNVCTDSQTLQRGIQLKKDYPNLFLAASATPNDEEKQADAFFPEVVQAAKEGHLVSIGETGLDYYYEYAPKLVQKKQLIHYFHLAKQVNLPIIFHCREAFEDLFSIAKEEYLGPALLHCFTGTLEEAKKVLDFGWLISFSGIVTFKKSEALKEVARYVPLDRMLIETDAPYLAPNSKRGGLNEPAFIAETAQMLADLKRISLEELASITKENASKFFSI